MPSDPLIGDGETRDLRTRLLATGAAPIGADSLPSLTGTAGHRYSVRELLGAGGMGVVYRAFDRLAGKEVALKLLRVHAVETAAAEFELLASIRHPNVIDVFDYGFDDDGRPFLTMELIDPVVRLTEAALPSMGAKGCVELLVPILEALTYMHRRGIMHLDLKPGNVLVSGGIVKVLDFGLATSIGSNWMLAGTPAYMAPELFRGAEPTPAADLYAVGVIGAELLFGVSAPRVATRDFVRDLARWLDTDHASYSDPEVAPSSDPELASGSDPEIAGCSSPDRARCSSPELARCSNPALASVLCRLLDADPERRFSSPESAIDALRRSVGSEVRAESTSVRESFLQSAPFVGRDQELSVLLTGLDDAALGKCSAWLIGGESGVGKSRLLRELRTNALVRRGLVLSGQARTEGEGAFSVWRDPLCALALASEPSPLEAGVLATVVPDIERLIEAPIEKLPPLRGPGAAHRLQSVVATLIARAGCSNDPERRRPVVLLLEDLHWTDPYSLELLAALIARSDLPLLAIGDYRDDETPGLPQRLPGARFLQLQRLPREAIAKLSRSILGAGPAAPVSTSSGPAAPVSTSSGPESDRHLADVADGGLIDFLERETEGNMFFLVEVLRVLAEDVGRLDAVRAMDLPEHVFGGGIAQLVERRLDRVPPEARPLLEFAAIAGRAIDPALLDSSGEGQATAWLFQCSDAALLEVREGRWQFTHDKFREGVLRALGPARRIELHREVARAIESTYPTSEEHLAALAHHWGQVGDREKAGDYSLRAGESEFRRAAFRKSLEHCQRAFVLAGSEEEAAIPLLLRLAYVHENLSQVEESERFARAALRKAERDGPDSARAESLQAIANAHLMRGEFDHSGAAAEQSLEIARRAGDVVQEARALITWGNSFQNRGRFEDSIQCYERALVLLETSPSSMAVGATLANLGMSRCYQGRFRDGIAPLERALETSRAIGDRRTEATALGNLGMVYSNTGQKRRALQCYESARKIREESGDRAGESLLIANCGSIQQAMGRMDAARDAFLRARELARQVEATREEALCTINLGSVHMDLGNLEESRKLYADGILRSVDLGERRFEGFARVGEAIACLRIGDPVRALASLDDAERLAEELGSADLGQRVTHNRAFIFLEVDRAEDAVSVIEAARARDPESVAYDVELIRAIALLQLGREKHARAAFEDVIRAADAALEGEPDLFQPRFDRALAFAALAASDEDESDRSERHALCKVAYIDALDRCAAAGVVEQALSLLRRVAACGQRQALLAEITLLVEKSRIPLPGSVSPEV